MKVTLVAVFASLVAAQTFQGLPSCATSCLNAFTGSGTIAGCNSIDIACICSNQSFLSSIACCLAAHCSVADQQAATQYALNICKTNAVTNLPTAVSCASTATSATSSGSAATGSTTSPTSSSGSSAASTGTTSPAGTLSHASSSTASSSTAAASQTKNAALQMIPGVGAGIAGGLAAVAIFL